MLMLGVILRHHAHYAMRADILGQRQPNVYH
eukprot:COSAG01_NODE_8159_length_2897_cov_6.563974_2_plen_30_part_01